MFGRERKPMDELPEHKQLAEDLRRARAQRIAAQNAMFQAPRHPNQMGVLSTAEYKKASDHERETGSKLDTMRDEAKVQLSIMARAQSEGKRIDAAEAQRLSNLINEITADLAAVHNNPGHIVNQPGPWDFMKGENKDARQ